MNAAIDPDSYALLSVTNTSLASAGFTRGDSVGAVDTAVAMAIDADRLTGAFTIRSTLTSRVVVSTLVDAAEAAEATGASDDKALLAAAGTTRLPLRALGFGDAAISR